MYLEHFLRIVFLLIPIISNSFACSPSNYLCKLANNGSSILKALTSNKIELNDECGLSFYEKNARIVGGMDAVDHSWPSIALIDFFYMADITIPELDIQVTQSFSARCGATLINRRTILTAAHCIVKNLDFEIEGKSYSIKVQPNKYFRTIESMYNVLLGVQNSSEIYTRNNISPAVNLKVSKIIQHEDFDESTIKNDIALIILKDEVDLNNYVQTACLPNAEKTNYDYVYAVGWGAKKYQGSSADVLQNVRLTVYDGEINCKMYEITDWSYQICAGDLTGKKDTCQGDSGGPLYISNSENRWTVVGIVSYGKECGVPGVPGIYTKVSSYLDWISNNLV